MSSNLPINKQIEKYIDEHSLKLHPVQNEIIKYNDTLGKKKKLQISINQCHFLYLLTKLFKFIKTKDGIHYNFLQIEKPSPMGIIIFSTLISLFT